MKQKIIYIKYNLVSKGEIVFATVLKFYYSYIKFVSIICKKDILFYKWCNSYSCSCFSIKYFKKTKKV